MKNKIVRLILIALAGIFSGSCFSPMNTKFEIEKGVNIAHWLSQSQKRGEERKNYFQKEEVKYLSSLGYDHLRLPVDEEQLFATDGTLDQETLSLVHNFILWCKEYNLRVVFDLHILRSHHFGNDVRPLWKEESEQDKFVTMWLAINKELQHYPEDLLAFELLNEPVAPDNSDWSGLAARTIKALREVAPQRMIIVGSNSFNSVTTVDKLEIPQGDTNLILSFHYYEPYALTHYQAHWSPFKTLDAKLYYPGQLISKQEYEKLTDEEKEIMAPYNRVYNRETIAAEVSKAQSFADSLNVKLYCGEFGCLPHVSDESRYAWYRDMISIFNEYNIAYTSWEYKEIFGFCNRDGSLKDNQLLNILLNKQEH